MSYQELAAGVIETGLCTRCGICAAACPVRAIAVGTDRYPELSGDCIDCGLCVSSCPGGDVNFPLLSRQLFDSDFDPQNLQGYVQQFFVAHAAEDSVRQAGTSGGLVTGLLVHLLESGVIDGAVVAGFVPEDPCTMKGVLATTAEEIVDAAQSKYCVTASMEALQNIRLQKGKYAVVGLPCQVQGLRKLLSLDSALAGKIYCIFGLYCHCNMEPRVQRDILKSRGIRPENISRFDFRGGGWPGGFHVVDREGKGIPLHSTLYTTILNVLFKIYGASRCYLCIDAMSEYADISFGDFWAHDYEGELSSLEQCTLVSQRSARGREILDRAAAAGAITMYPLPPERFSRRINNMAAGKKRRGLARIYRMGRKGLPVPDYHFSVQAPTAKAGRKETMVRLSFLLRGRIARRILLKLLFSRAASWFELVNQSRKRIFCNYHGN